MGFWGALVGGVVGGLVGGPVGAGIGAGLGAALDETSSEGNDIPELPMELEWRDDDDGRVLLIQPGFDTNGVIAYRVDFLSRSTGRLVAGMPPYRDDDGDFFAFAEPAPDGTAACYVGFGFSVNHEDDAVTRIIVLTDDGVRGAGHFEMPWPGGHGCRARLLRPLVAVGMRVARADGALAREEVARIRETVVDAFELGASERESLRSIMKESSAEPIEELAWNLQLRFPQMNMLDVVEFLADIAHSDGRLDPAETAVIRGFAVVCGATDEDWLELEDALGLRSASGREDELLAIFGLPPGSSLRDVKTAYRAKMRDYHPDKVAHLPDEFQEVAVRKSQELNEAYEALCLILASRAG